MCDSPWVVACLWELYFETGLTWNSEIFSLLPPEGWIKTMCHHTQILCDI